MYVFVTNVLDKGGSLPPNPRPEADRDGNRTTTPTTAPRSTKDLRPHIRAFIQAREGGRPQMGSPRPKGESPREPEATGSLVRFKGPRCPRTTQHPAENPPPRLNGPVTYPGTNKHLYPGEGQKSPAGTMSHRGQGSGSPKHKPSHGHTLIQSTHSLSLTHQRYTVRLFFLPLKYAVVWTTK